MPHILSLTLAVVPQKQTSHAHISNFAQWVHHYIVSQQKCNSNQIIPSIVLHNQRGANFCSKDSGKHVIFNIRWEIRVATHPAFAGVSRFLAPSYVPL